MNILINALSVTNASGRHVLLGHLSRFALWTADRHKYFVLYHKANMDICRNLGLNVEWVECPGYTENWLMRTLWEQTKVSAAVSRLGTGLLFTPAGTAISNLEIPQISFAQNPWCLVRGIHHKPVEKFKAVLQRRAYRQAMRIASMMIFNSEYMRQAYRKNAGFNEKASEVIYQGLDDETFSAAAELAPATQKKPNQILSVSVMAPHKGVETLVKAVALTRENSGIDVSLLLVGGWPDTNYERMIKSLVNRLGLEDAVKFKGHVSREELHRFYAESKVFCLMSRCESFGIPAVEAQAFGTPVVSSNCCAIPEVCGHGGVYPESGDVQSVAAHLTRLLTDDKVWKQLSNAAKKNAEKYRWDICSRPFEKIFDRV